MNTLDRVLEDASQLPDEHQEMPIKILQQRRYENRRAEIARDARQSLDDFRAGKLPPQSAKDVIAELRQCLDDTEA